MRGISLARREHLTHVQDHVLEKQCHRWSYKSGERDFDSVLDPNPYDSVLRASVLVVVHCQSVVIVTRHVVVRARVRLYQRSPILPKSGIGGEFFHRQRMTWTPNLKHLVRCISPNGGFLVSIPPVKPGTPAVSGHEEDNVLVSICGRVVSRWIVHEGSSYLQYRYRSRRALSSPRRRIRRH